MTYATPMDLAKDVIAISEAIELRLGKSATNDERVRSVEYAMQIVEMQSRMAGGNIGSFGAAVRKGGK